MGAYREGMEGMEKAEMLGLLLRHAVSTEWTTERQKWALSWGTHGWSPRVGTQLWRHSATMWKYEEPPTVLTDERQVQVVDSPQKSLSPCTGQTA